MTDFFGLKVGDKLRNNDPRKGGDVVTITHIVPTTHIRHPLKGTSGYVKYHTGKRFAEIAKHRIFFDGKERHQGYNYVTEADIGPATARIVRGE
jgi:hypothetical protein